MGLKRSSGRSRTTRIANLAHTSLSVPTEEIFLILEELRSSLPAPRLRRPVARSGAKAWAQMFCIWRKATQTETWPGHGGLTQANVVQAADSAVPSATSSLPLSSSV